MNKNKIRETGLGLRFAHARPSGGGCALGAASRAQRLQPRPSFPAASSCTVSSGTSPSESEADIIEDRELGKSVPCCGSTVGCFEIEQRLLVHSVSLYKEKAAKKQTVSWIVLVNAPPKPEFNWMSTTSSVSLSVSSSRSGSRAPCQTAFRKCSGI